MRQEVKHEVYGVIAYEESALSGSKNISINGVELTKTGKTTYSGVVNEETLNVTLKGSFLSGVTVTINEEAVEVVSQTKWYEYVLYFLPFFIVLVWGNSIELCAIVPVVGGAIGGGISAGLSLCTLVFSKRVKNVLHKLLIGLAGLVVTFGVCVLIGILIQSALVA